MTTITHNVSIVLSNQQYPLTVTIDLSGLDPLTNDHMDQITYNTLKAWIVSARAILTDNPLVEDKYNVAGAENLLIEASTVRVTCNAPDLQLSIDCKTRPQFVVDMYRASLAATDRMANFYKDKLPALNQTRQQAAIDDITGYTVYDFNANKNGAYDTDMFSVVMHIGKIVRTTTVTNGEELSYYEFYQRLGSGFAKYPIGGTRIYSDNADDCAELPDDIINSANDTIIGNWRYYAERWIGSNDKKGWNIIKFE